MRGVRKKGNHITFRVKAGLTQKGGARKKETFPRPKGAKNGRFKGKPKSDQQPTKTGKTVRERSRKRPGALRKQRGRGTIDLSKTKERKGVRTREVNQSEEEKKRLGENESQFDKSQHSGEKTRISLTGDWAPDEGHRTKWGGG